jgi:hypothetical protein
MPLDTITTTTLATLTEQELFSIFIDVECNPRFWMPVTTEGGAAS